MHVKFKNKQSQSKVSESVRRVINSWSKEENREQEGTQGSWQRGLVEYRQFLFLDMRDSYTEHLFCSNSLSYRCMSCAFSGEKISVCVHVSVIFQ